MFSVTQVLSELKSYSLSHIIMINNSFPIIVELTHPGRGVPVCECQVNDTYSTYCKTFLGKFQTSLSWNYYYFVKDFSDY